MMTTASGPILLSSLTRTAGEPADVRPSPESHPPGTAIELMGIGLHRHPAWISHYVADHGRLLCWAVVAGDGEEPPRLADVAMLHPHGSRRGIGYYEAAQGTAPMPLAELAALRAQAEQSRADRAAAQAAAIEAQTNAKRRGEALWPTLIGDAPAVLVAEYREDRSDPYTDYVGHATMRRVIVGRLPSERVNFKAWRKVAAAHPDPAIQALADGDEHRQTWSMGGGYFMTAKGGGREHGIILRSYVAKSEYNRHDILVMLGEGNHPWKQPPEPPAAAPVDPAPVAEAAGSTVPIAEPSGGSALRWKPVPGSQTAALRAAGLSVQGLRDAGFRWTRAGQWEAQPSDAARSILAKLGGAP
jgi:hypothetical protein